MMTLEAPRTNFLKHLFIVANKSDLFCQISAVFCAPFLCRTTPPSSSAWVKNLWCHVSLSAIWVSRMRSKCTHTGLTRQIRWVYECKTHKIVTRYVSVWEKKFLWFFFPVVFRLRRIAETLLRQGCRVSFSVGIDLVRCRGRKRSRLRLIMRWCSKATPWQ